MPEHSHDQEPLDYALAVIEAYEDFIRQAIDRGEIPKGFCQAVAFTGARRRVRELQRRRSTGIEDMDADSRLP